MERAPRIMDPQWLSLKSIKSCPVETERLIYPWTKAKGKWQTQQSF